MRTIGVVVSTASLRPADLPFAQDTLVRMPLAHWPFGQERKTALTAEANPVDEALNMGVQQMGYGLFVLRAVVNAVEQIHGTVKL